MNSDNTRAAPSREPADPGDPDETVPRALILALREQWRSHVRTFEGIPSIASGREAFRLCAEALDRILG